MLQVVADQQPTSYLLRTFVGGLPYHCDERELYHFMQAFGQVEHVFISRGIGGHHKGYAFVDFVASTTSLKVFGEHFFKKKAIEVKRNFLNHLIFSDVPPRISPADIQRTIESNGIKIAEALLGDGSNGLPWGTISVRLEDERQIYQFTPEGLFYVKGEAIQVQAKINNSLTKSALEPGMHKKNCAKRSSQVVKCREEMSLAQQKNIPTATVAVPEKLLVKEKSGQANVSFAQKKLLDLTLSTDQREGGELLSISDSGNKRKAGSTLWASSQAFDAPKRLDSFEADLPESRSVTGKVVEMTYTLPGHSRHQSGSEETRNRKEQFPKRLNSLSTSFFSPSEQQSPIEGPNKPCTISYFTFPGRD